MPPILAWAMSANSSLHIPLRACSTAGYRWVLAHVLAGGIKDWSVGGARMLAFVPVHVPTVYPDVVATALDRCADVCREAAADPRWTRRAAAAIAGAARVLDVCGVDVPGLAVLG